MKKTLTNNEIFGLGNAINQAKQLGRRDFKWNYCLNKNGKIVADTIKTIQESIPEEADKETLDKIGKESTEIELFGFVTEEFFSDANALETDLYLDYFIINQ